MRTQTEIDNKVAKLQLSFEKNVSDRKIIEIQIDILMGLDDADNYEDHEDSWIHQGAERAREWMDGDDNALN